MPVEMVEVWDLSSDIPYRPAVSSPSPAHSSSASKSLALNGLQQEVDEILTPVINNLMSPPMRPRNHELVSISSGTEFRFTNVDGRLQSLDFQESVMSEFSQWDQYKQTKERVPHLEPTRSLSNSRPSVKGTGLTTRKELKQQAQKKKFLFHRGFFKRSTAARRTTMRHKRLKSRAEVEASLIYTNLRSFRPEDVTSSNKAIVYRPRSIVRRCPGVKVASEIPVKRYVSGISNKDCTRLPRIRGLSTCKIERSNTCPAAVRNIRRRSYSPEARAIHALWKEYLSLVIAQRIELRTSLLKYNNESGQRGTTRLSSFYSSSTKSSITSTDRRLSSLRLNC